MHHTSKVSTHQFQQILRQDFVSQQKQWQDELARSAPVEPVAPEEEESEAQPDLNDHKGLCFIVLIGKVH